jgi:N-acetylneuraminate synthase
VGYSGHESTVSPSIIAGSLGAVAIERHITLDRSMWGTDHSASLEPSGLNQLVGALRKIPIVLGDGIKKEIEGEKEMANKLRYWN